MVRSASEASAALFRLSSLSSSSPLPGSFFLHHPSPNHALQRTEAGGTALLVYPVLPRQPLSLSLSPLGAAPFHRCSMTILPLASSSLRRRCAVTLHFVRRWPWARRRRTARPSSSRFTSGRLFALRAVWPFMSGSPDLRQHFRRSRAHLPARLTTRSSEQRLAVGLFRG